MQVIVYPNTECKLFETAPAIYGVDKIVPIHPAITVYETPEQLMLRATLEQPAICVCTPTQEALNIYGIDAIARRDVPPGLPYLICPLEDIPKLPCDFSTFTSGVGNHSNLWD